MCLNEYTFLVVPNGKTLDETARIGVILPFGICVFTGSLTGKATADNFISDDVEYVVVLNDNGEATLVAREKKPLTAESISVTIPAQTYKGSAFPSMIS